MLCTDIGGYNIEYECLDSEMPEGAYYTCRVLWSNTEIELAIVPANKDGKLDRLDVGPGYTFDATTGRKRVFVSLCTKRPGKNAFLALAGFEEDVVATIPSELRLLKLRTKP